MRMVCFLKVVGECGNVTKMQQAYQKLGACNADHGAAATATKSFLQVLGFHFSLWREHHIAKPMLLCLCAQLCSCSNPIYEVDKSNNILPSATAGCHYAEFLIYSSKSLSVKVQFTREDDNKGKRRVKWLWTHSEGPEEYLLLPVCVCILKAAISKQSIKTQADGAIKIQENSAIFFSGPENPLFIFEFVLFEPLRSSTKKGISPEIHCIVCRV